MLDGLRARPYTAQLSGSPKARAKSGARSLHAWQRDYNSNGRLDEKVVSLRHQKVSQMRQRAVSEAARRKLPVEAVEFEMQQAQSAASKRIDTGIGRNVEMSTPCRTVPSDGGPPRLFDGSARLESNFSLKDAQDMFRGEAWNSMTETLEMLDEFKPPARSLEQAQKAPINKRGSFSSGVTPAELNKAMSKAKKEEAVIAAADLASLKKLLVRKYGTLWAAWRHALQADGIAQLSFAMFSKSMRMVGFKGNVKAIWKQLDDDNSGLVSFAELDPTLAARISDFKVKTMSAYGQSWEEVWKVVDRDRNMQVDLNEFEEVCNNIGHVGNPVDLFKQLRAHPSRNFLNLEDFKSIPMNWGADRTRGYERDG